MRLLRQTAAEGIVLLKNNGALPFRTKRCVALFGENSYNFLSGGTGSGCVHPPYVVDILEGLKNAGITSTETMTIPIRDLASFDEAGSQWLTEAGTYTFRIGASSRDIKATAQLKLAEYTEKTTNALAPKQKLNLLKQ